MIAKKQIPNIPGKRAIFTSSCILVLGIVVLVWYVINFQDNLVETAALESAKLYSQALAEFRTIYTAKVVQKVNSHPDFEITHDYEGLDHGIGHFRLVEVDSKARAPAPPIPISRQTSSAASDRKIAPPPSCRQVA